MSDFSVQIKGAAALARAIHDPGLLDDLLRPGFDRAGVIVSGKARGNVHQVTRKLMGSLGYTVQGKGHDLETHVGPQPGTGQPRGYTKSMTSRWQKPRKGKNTGDAQVYARYEEEGTRYRPAHPFLVPALTSSADQIESVIGSEAAKALPPALRKRGL
jgi:HK97 gp10 family phage protein